MLTSTRKYRLIEQLVELDCGHVELLRRRRRVAKLRRLISDLEGYLEADEQICLEGPELEPEPDPYSIHEGFF